MKKKLTIFNCIIAMAMVAAFTACNKEMDHPVNSANSNYSLKPATSVVNTSTVIKRKPPIWDNDSVIVTQP